MNPLAKELNLALEGSIALSLLSDFGKRFYFPKGIVAQSAEAKKHAHRLNATIGMAFHDKQPIELPSVGDQLPKLKPADAVAYAPTPGIPELRNMWKELIIEKNPTIDRDRISLPVVVPGLTNGIMQAADLFVDPGDSVIIPDMFWGNYRLIFEGRKEATLYSFPFFTSRGTLNVQGFEETIRQNAKDNKAVVMINFPNNPTGYSPTEREVEELIEALEKCAEDGFKLLVISDDAYFGLFYDENTYSYSLFTQLYDLHENLLAIKVDGATKEDFVWGFRVGFLTFGSKGLLETHYEALNTKLTGALRSSISNSSRPAQSILLQAMKGGSYRSEKQRYFEMLQSRYLKVREIIDKRETGSALEPLPFNSGYFMSFLCRGISAERLRKELLMEEGIGTISIQDTYLRVAYASIELEQLEDLYHTIFSVADKLKTK